MCVEGVRRPIDFTIKHERKWSSFLSKKTDVTTSILVHSIVLLIFIVHIIVFFIAGSIRRYPGNPRYLLAIQVLLQMNLPLELGYKFVTKGRLIREVPGCHWGTWEDLAW